MYNLSVAEHNTTNLELTTEFQINKCKKGTSTRQRFKKFMKRCDIDTTFQNPRDGIIPKKMNKVCDTRGHNKKTEVIIKMQYTFYLTIINALIFVSCFLIHYIVRVNYKSGT